MSEPISAGDLVIQIASCCDRAGGKIGVPGIAFSVTDDTTWCEGCKRRHNGLMVRIAGEPHHWASPAPWFKRIPPISELESEKRNEEITA